LISISPWARDFAISASQQSNLTFVSTVKPDSRKDTLGGFIGRCTLFSRTHAGLPKEHESDWIHFVTPRRRRETVDLLTIVSFLQQKHTSIRRLNVEAAQA
jgi:hypothetical protein